MFINTSVHESAVNQESVAGGFYLRYPLLGRITEVLEPCLSTRTDRRLLGNIDFILNLYSLLF